MSTALPNEMSIFLAGISHVLTSFLVFTCTVSVLQNMINETSVVQSRCDMTREILWISVASQRNFLLFFGFVIDKNAHRQRIQLSFASMLSPALLILLVLHLSSCCLLPNNIINSVFEAFMFNLFSLRTRKLGLLLY